MSYLNFEVNYLLTENDSLSLFVREPMMNNCICSVSDENH